MPRSSRQTPSLTRCAIYTRKSTSPAPGIQINTLATQREVCSAYIRSQCHRNWIEVSHSYDDGGFSGGSLERPALKRLINDVEAGRVDMIVVYKIDRLSRSLGDFVRLIDVLDKYGASFVSVTQTFDTSDSMGRLVLNILLTFAQFERELASDRTRDKKAALLRKGIFTGGTPPLGYKLEKGGRLVIDDGPGELVREMFRRFPLVPANQLAREFAVRGCRTPKFTTKSGRVRGGWPIYTSRILKTLSNPIYAGYFEHRGDWIRAEVEPLVDKALWDTVQEIKRSRHPYKRDPVRNFLLGILHDEHGRRMRMHGATGRSTGTRYYKSEYAGWSRDGVTRRVMVDADKIEPLVVSALQAFLSDRVQLKEAILSLGRYSDEVARALKRGSRAARRLCEMDQLGLRSALLALLPRAEVSAGELKLYVSCFEVSRFLSWNGVGLFEKSTIHPARAADKVHCITCEARLIAGHPRFALPIEPRKPGAKTAKPWLVHLVNEAAELRSFAHAHRDMSVGELARAKGIRPSNFARMLRVNYLAPDIQTAILDGTQPDSLTAWDLLKGPMPLEWQQQRQLLGFS
jgi:site-specific DNA recombinase